MLGRLKRILPRGRRDDAQLPPHLRHLAPRQAAFFRGETLPILQGWRPALRDSQMDVSVAWHRAAARALDALQNSGWIAGILEEVVAQTIGDGLKLVYKPDPSLFGGNDADAAAYARMVEPRFRAWANTPAECDLHGRHTLAELTAAAYRAWFAMGEVLALLPRQRRPGAATLTKVLLLEPHQLARVSEPPRVRDGVVLDDAGAPIAYRIHAKRDGLYDDEVEVRARDRYGRQQVLHVFEGMPGQVRGITPLAPALKVWRQYDQLADATLTNVLLQTLFAATLRSPAPPSEVYEALKALDETGQGNPLLGYLTGAAQFHEETKLDLSQQGKVVHLFPGEELEFNAVKNPNASYEEFSAGLLRELARCFGVSFEQLTGDYRNATYSSVRMSIAMIWPLVMRRRKHIAARLPQAAFENWLEEEILSGRLEFPGGPEAFLANRHLATQADWRGPGKPTADDYKTARATEIELDLGLTTLEAAAAERGHDWEDIAAQRARERQRYQELGLQYPLDVRGGNAADKAAQDAAVMGEEATQ